MESSWAQRGFGDWQRLRGHALHHAGSGCASQQPALPPCAGARVLSGIARDPHDLNVTPWDAGTVKARPALTLPDKCCLGKEGARETRISGVAFPARGPRGQGPGWVTRGQRPAWDTWSVSCGAEPGGFAIRALPPPWPQISLCNNGITPLHSPGAFRGGLSEAIPVTGLHQKLLMTSLL